jgi:hypothetical protein
MHYDYDAIVVGARCAGASTAMLLACRGHRALLVDRARLPSDIPHGHFIHRHGPPRLARWGLLDRIVASGCPPVRSMSFYFGDFQLVAHNLDVDGVAWGYGPRRAVVDNIPLDAAIAAGAEVRNGLAVEGLLYQDDRVVDLETTEQAHAQLRQPSHTHGMSHASLSLYVKPPLGIEPVLAGIQDPTLSLYSPSFANLNPSLKQESMTAYRTSCRVAVRLPTWMASSPPSERAAARQLAMNTRPPWPLAVEHDR